MINKIIESYFEKCFRKINLSVDNIRIIRSNRPNLCDYQFDGVFRLASLEKKNPIELGNYIVDNLIKEEDYNKYFKSIEFCKPGFINITLSDYLINDSLRKMSEGYKFNIDIPKKEKFFLDYGGYNIAKPLHIGHLRPTIIGESIKRIIKYFDNDVIADVHLGDYGLQMGQVIYGILRDNISINEINIDYLNRIYPEISKLCKEDESILEKCSQITKSLQEGETKYTEIWQKIVSVSLENIKKITNYLDVSYDLWEGESDAYKYLPKTEKILTEKNLLQKSNGAQIVEVKKENENKPMPPLIFKKSNGAYLYESTDVASLVERKEKYNPDHVIYITDFRQNLHFEQVFRVSDMADIINYNSLEHAYNGTINGKDGKPFKTRQGDAPKLEELFKIVKEEYISKKESNKDMTEKDLNIIVNAIIKFADLQNSREKDYIFDVEKFADITGKTGPYILYTFVRIKKILENYNFPIEQLSNIIYNDEDRNLRLELLELENNLKQAFINRMPSYIANYIYDVCVKLNIFYQNNHILSLDDKKKQNDWIYLLSITNRIIKEMLSLLIIDVPSAM